MDLTTLITSTPSAAVALVMLYLFFAGKVHSDSEFQRVLKENDDLKSALADERQASNELAMTGGVTNKLIGALVDVATERNQSPVPRGHDLTPGDLGL